MARGYNNFSELNFSPDWRQDYHTYLKKVEFIHYFCFLNFLLSFKIFKQIFNFLTCRFQTKMEMVPYKYLKLSLLTLKS